MLIGESPMKLEVFKDADSVARAAARTIAADARTAIAARGRFALAASGGHTPWIMLRALAEEDLPWAGVHVFQVDERLAPAGDPDRNLTHLRESLLQHAPLRPEQIHAMPVEVADLQTAATQHAFALREMAVGDSPKGSGPHLSRRAPICCRAVCPRRRQGRSRHAIRIYADVRNCKRGPAVGCIQSVGRLRWNNAEKTVLV